MANIRSALISVFSKEGLEPILELLHKLQVDIYSTGGTQAFIEKQGIPVNAVEDLTGYPSILGGRVKTLHPKVFGGILGRREDVADVKEMEKYEIPPIDLIIVDLYPFQDTVANSGSHDEIIEKIDIGGISLIRAAAKNYKYTTVVSSKQDYSRLEKILREQGGAIEETQRKTFAANAFRISSEYDTAIFNYMNGDGGESKKLRYGENPHQDAWFHGNLEDLFVQHHGKELSYNNLVDVDAALNLGHEFANDDPSFVIIKHTNACGIATRTTIKEAYLAALACDNISAFGGILMSNRPIDEATAMKIDDLFMEVLLAPSYEPKALEILKSKKNRRLLEVKNFQPLSRLKRSLLNGEIEQTGDLKTESTEQMTTVTERSPKEKELENLAFAVKAVKHLKSNTIVLAKDKQLIGMGCGQTSRVDALKQAIAKAKQFGFDTTGAVMASDAFFPFPDCVEIADKAGITAVVQPGGSIKDKDSIDYCNAHDMAMVTTGIRHFKH